MGFAGIGSDRGKLLAKAQRTEASTTALGLTKNRFAERMDNRGYIPIKQRFISDLQIEFFEKKQDDQYNNMNSLIEKLKT